jgi:hypothetical protein
MKTKSRFFAAALLAASATVGAAEFHAYVPGNGNLTVNNPGGAGFASVNVTGYNGVGGQFSGNFWDVGAKPAESFLRFFCIELTEHANSGPNPYTSSIFSDDDLRKLYDVAYPNKATGDFWNAGQTNLGDFSDATLAAAFQVAVWNIVFDGDLSLAGGTFQWTGAATSVSSTAQSWLDQVAAYSGSNYANWTLYKFVSPIANSTQPTGYQNYVSATYRVPEPGSPALIGLALIAIGAAFRPRRG